MLVAIEVEILPLEGWLTFAQVAEKLGLSYQRVQQMVFDEHEFNFATDVRQIGNLHILRAEAVESKAANREAEIAAGLVLTPAARAERSIARAQEQAESFAELARAAGWDARVETGTPHPNSAVVTAQLGDREVRVVWRGAIYQNAASYIRYRDRVRKVVSRDTARRELTRERSIAIAV